MLRLTSIVAAILLVQAAPALAGGMTDGSPGQVTLDGGAGSQSLNGGTWADVAGGTQARPYLKSITVINGANSRVVYSGGPGGVGPTQVGDVTAAISATNVCAAGQAQGCYSTPNRVGVQFGYVTAGGGIGRNFADPTVPLTSPVDANTTLDVVIGLGTIGEPLRWTWANGALESWKTSNLGDPSGELRIRLHPSLTPTLDWSGHPEASGCSATPIRDCEIAQEDGESLEAGMVLSLDDTLPSALKGAVFATQHALMGYLQPGGTATAPLMDLQIASSHLRADGSRQLGTLQAFLPAAGLDNLYGFTPDQAASGLEAARVGDPGTSDAPTFAVRTDDETSSAGLLVTVSSITFSAPTYRISARTSLPTPSAPSPGLNSAPSLLTPAPPAPARPAPTPSTTSNGLRVQSASRRGGVVLQITGAQKGVATTQLLVKGRVAATGQVTIGASGAAALRIHLSKSAARKLRSVRHARLRVTLPGQAARTITIALT